MKKVLLSLIVGIVLVGCGGGSSSSEEDTTNPPPEENTVLLIESGTTSFSSGKPYNIKGSSDIYYDTVGCRLSGLGLTNFSVYDNGSVKTFYTKNGTTYSSTCYIKDAYENVALNNTTEVNASYVNYHTFYDNATKIFYDHDGYSQYGNYRLVEIINDGMNAVVDMGNGNTITVQIEAAYRKVGLDTIGITPYSPSSSFYLGNPDEVMETAYGIDETTKPYNIKGYLYNYKHSGCLFNVSGGGYYEIHNDGTMMSLQDDRTTSICTITEFYENVKLSNTTDVNASYVNYHTFYDNATKIFYDHDGYSHDGDYRLVEIINDGMNAVVDAGNGNTVTVQIEAAYRKVQ